MSVNLPIEVFEIFEKNFGREDAKVVLKSLEDVIDEETVNKWHKTKEELKEEFLKEVATKKELETLRIELLSRIDGLKSELSGTIEATKAELLGKIEKDKTELTSRIDKIDLTLKFLIIINYCNSPYESCCSRTY